ncbi:MAG: hypothetical protein U0319_04835 [Nitrospira sp.]
MALFHEQVLSMADLLKSPQLIRLDGKKRAAGQRSRGTGLG